jgi:hypothetical protein
VGTNTTNFKLYKPASSEIADPDTQVNSNLDIADTEARMLFGYKWHKTYNCGQWFWRDNGGGAFSSAQDINSGVGSWLDFTSQFDPLYTGVGTRQTVTWPYIRFFSRGTGKLDVWMSGQMKLVSGAELPLNTNVTIATLPTQYRPVVPKSFLTYAGVANSSSSYSITRIDLLLDGSVQYCRMGANTLDSSQRHVCLDGIFYSTEVAA